MLSEDDRMHPKDLPVRQIEEAKKALRQALRPDTHVQEREEAADQCLEEFGHLSQTEREDLRSVIEDLGDSLLLERLSEEETFQETGLYPTN